MARGLGGLSYAYDNATRKRIATQYNLFIVEVVKAWIDRSQKHPRTIHHHGHGTFVVDGETIKLPSRMK